MQRRKFLKIIGGSTIFAGCSVAIYAAPTAKSARAAWDSAGQYTDPMRFALSCAILAPNPHNRQPWQIALTGAHEATLYCDPQRHLPHTDPLDRQITIGLGCFLEQFAIAAAHKGYRAEYDLFPEGANVKRLDERPVAHIHLVKAKLTMPTLFPYILNRKTDRTQYTDTRPGADQMDSLTKIAGPMAASTRSPALVQSVAKLCAIGTRTEFQTPAAHGESMDLMRIGRKQVRANPDGISLEGPMMELMKLSGVLSVKAMRDPTSTAFAQGVKMGMDACHATPALIWITTPGNTRTEQIEAGRTYARANLQATATGLSMQPMSAVLQEYPEMAEHLRAVHSLLQIKSPNRLQMLARVGYGTGTVHSPRWPLSTRILPNA